MDLDPLQGLESWAKETERRVSRANRLHRIRAAMRFPRMGLRPTAAVLAIVLVGALLWLTRGNWAQWGTGPVAYPTISQPAGAYATSRVSNGGTDEFDGTPAQAFASGEAGIAVPEPFGVDGWTVQQVADALGQIRQVLILVYLQPAALVDHDPTALLPLFAPNARNQMQQQYSDPTQPGVAVLISPSVKLAAKAPRVNGRTTVRAAKVDGVATLEVNTNYVLVYAFEVADRGPGSRLVVVHQETVWRLLDPKRTPAANRGLWIHQTDGYQYNVDCAEAAKGLLAPSRADGVNVAPRATAEHPDGFYDPNRSIDVDDTCR